MSLAFEFATAGRIRFGDGVLRELPAWVAERGARALLVVGAHPERHAELRAALADAGVAVSVFSVAGEPTTERAAEGVALAQAAEVEVVVGLGGGSVLDAGKAIAALVTNGGAPLDYLEVVGAGKTIARPSLPYAAVPTTAGTGAEVTRNAVLTSEAHGVKVSLRHSHMLPRLALVDPVLTHGVPPAVTAATGLDALTQVLEPYVCNQPSPISDALCREAMARAARSLRRAYLDGADAEARADLALTSLFGGLALANARLGAVHGFAGPIGGRYGGPHGAVCARLLPFVIEANLRALRSRAPGSPVLGRYDEVARILTGRAGARAEDAVSWVRELVAALSIPPLGRYGLGAADLDPIVDAAMRASSMKGNPIELTRDELAGVLEQAR
jgi:alcohol dehydrogenase class IV